MNASTALPPMLIAGLVLLLPAQAATYRWTDEGGKVNYADQVPPEQAKHRRSKLNDQGLEVEVVEGAKSPEQLEKERKLKELRAEQERLLAEQRDRDLSLLRTYRTEDELYLTLQGKLNTLDSTIRITESNRDRQQQILLGHEKRAAEFERQGQKVPQNLLDSIASARRQIASYQDKIRLLEADKQAITDRFTKDLARFRAIKTQQNEMMRQGTGKRELLATEDQRGSDGIIISAVALPAGAVSDQAWDVAKTYVLAQATTPLSIETEKILRTASPLNDKDIAITVTRIPAKQEDIFFLDVRCRSSSLGEEVCAGPQVREIRRGFKSYIQAGLKSAPQQ